MTIPKNTTDTLCMLYAKSSKKAGYEFSQLLQTCMQLEHTSMPDSNIQ